MKTICTLVCILVVIFSSTGLSSQSDGSSTGSRQHVSARSPRRTLEHGSPSNERFGEHLNVPSDHDEPAHHGARQAQMRSSLRWGTKSEHAGNQTQHSNDILLPLPLAKWTLLAESLKRDWPAHAEYYYFVITAIKWRLKEPNLQHEIYCPNGAYDSGIFVGISSYGDHYVITFANEGFENLLYKAVTETRIIDWAEVTTFVAISPRIISTVHSIIDTLKRTDGLEVQSVHSENVFFIPKEETAALKIEVPDGCYLDKIKESDIPLIHSLWPHRNQENPEITTKLIRTRVKLNRGLGLFSKKNNELLSWNLQGEFGQSAVTQTLEGARRRGYAKVVKCAFAKELAKYGFDMFGFVMIGNTASEAFWKSLNAKVRQPVAYITTRKSRNQQ